jgi:hypothetical protein
MTASVGVHRLLLAALMLPGAIAADLDERAIEIAAAWSASPLSYRLDAPNGRFAGEASSTRWAAELGVRSSFAQPGRAQGPGAGAHLIIGTGEVGGGTLTETQLRGGLGWGWALDPAWSCWTHLRLGGGWARWQDGADGAAPTGLGWTMGADVGAAWSPTTTWAITARVGYVRERWYLNGDDLRLHLSGDGLRVALGWEWRPGSARGLE